MADPTQLPRRGDEDLRESTDAPVFLVQRRRLVVTSLPAVDYDVDREAYVDSVTREVLSEEDIVAEGHGVWEWDTQRVAFTRAEGDRHARDRAHDGPFRVYSVPAMGELRTVLRALTDYEECGG